FTCETGFLRDDGNRSARDDGAGFVGNGSGEGAVRLAVEEWTEGKHRTQNRRVQRSFLQHQSPPWLPLDDEERRLGDYSVAPGNAPREQEYPFFSDGPYKSIRKEMSRVFVSCPVDVLRQNGNSLFHNAYAFADFHNVIALDIVKVLHQAARPPNVDGVGLNRLAQSKMQRKSLCEMYPAPLRTSCVCW